MVDFTFGGPFIMRGINAYLLVVGKILAYNQRVEWFRSYLLANHRVLLLGGNLVFLWENYHGVVMIHE